MDLRSLVWLNLFLFIGCSDSVPYMSHSEEHIVESSEEIGRCALLLTRFSSYEEFTSMVDVVYSEEGVPGVQLSYDCEGGGVNKFLNSGVSELDLVQVKDQGLLKRISLVFRSPYGILNIKKLKAIYAMTRRRQGVYGEGDVAFYDIAETMMYNIISEDRALMPSKDISEKGYINTFNHIVAQALMTSIYSEKLADFVADIHERRNLPELVSGNFSAEQKADIENGAVDNLVDIINNEWGQQLGLKLKAKFDMNKNTVWNPDLLKDYLNEIQMYCSWTFEIGFKPFKASDELIIKFSNKINSILNDVPAINEIL